MWACDKLAVHVCYVTSHHVGLKVAQSWKEALAETFSSFFIQKFKVINISDASASQYSRGGLGNFKNKYKAKKAKKQNMT